MKWYINLIALYAALATASPTPSQTIDFSKDRGGTLVHDKRKTCGLKNIKECCCDCAEGAHWPCKECTGVSNFTKERVCDSFIPPFFWLTMAIIVHILLQRGVPGRCCFHSKYWI
jgi:hypothetical protein